MDEKKTNIERREIRGECVSLDLDVSLWVARLFVCLCFAFIWWCTRSSFSFHANVCHTAATTHPLPGKIRETRESERLFPKIRSRHSHMNARRKWCTRARINVNPSSACGTRPMCDKWILAKYAFGWNYFDKKQIEIWSACTRWIGK